MENVVQVASNHYSPLLSAVTATGAGSTYKKPATKCSFQAYGTTTAGAGAATITVEVSNDGTNWLTMGTITLTLSTTAANDGFTSDSPWTNVRGNVTAISGTGASVTLTMGW